MNIQLRKTTVEDLETLYLFQLNEEAIHLAAFTSKNHTDRITYFEKWTRFLQDKSINTQTILYNGHIAGSVGKYMMEEEAEITYWLGRDYWGKGIATKALQQFLKLETTRPINGHVAFDNISSQKVLENCGFVKTGSVQYFANARGKEIEEFIYRLA
ncbi:MAG: GNAT family N-acetyltransferase [Bacteroidota bacterium]